MVLGGAPKIKIIKNKNGFFEDKNKSGKYLNLKEYIINNNIMRNIFRNICLIIVTSLLQIILSNNNLKYIENKFYNITLKINGTGNKKIFTSNKYFNSSYYPNMIYINGIKKSTINYSYYLNKKDNIVKLIWNNRINSCLHMFMECEDITEIDFSNFDTSMVTNMASMFWCCTSLSSLNLSNLDTSKVTNMGLMFYDCSSLSSLDLSKFNTSKVTNMRSMFNYCISLSSLDLSNFDTSKVTDMDYMFDQCSSLSSLDVSNFYTSKVTDMDRMFLRCSSLSSLDLSNFDTSKVINMDSMFSDCKKLEYINLKNFIENESLSFKSIFSNVPDNVVICLNEKSTKIKTQIKKSYILNCSAFDKKIVRNNFISIENFYNISLNEQLCIKCNEDYYEIENDNYTDKDGYIKCYKVPIGYYLDKNESKYKKCFYTCKECEITGNNITHNGLKCNDNY